MFESSIFKATFTKFTLFDNICFGVALLCVSSSISDKAEIKKKLLVSWKPQKP